MSYKNFFQRIFGSITFLEDEAAPADTESFIAQNHQSESIGGRGTVKNEIHLPTSLAELADGQYKTQKSLTGKVLPNNWPQIASPEAVQDAYNRNLFDPEDDRSQPPSKAHIERLSYELVSGNKRLRFFATYHQRDMQRSNDPNLIQYELLEKKFNESPPQLVLYEGYIDDIDYPISREQALQLGEPAWMLYLVQQHNAQVPESEKVIIKSGDAHVNHELDDIRDAGIVRNIAEKLNTFDRIDIVFGSGHAIRDEAALRILFGEEAVDMSEIRELYETDQKDRIALARDSSIGLQVRQRDEQRLKRAKELIASGDISDPQELNMLAYIFQHGDTADDYRRALQLTTAAVDSGLPIKESLIPLATDRLMIQEQIDRGVPLRELKQKYGTQIRYDEDGNAFQPPLDGTATKEDFEKFGLEQ